MNCEEIGITKHVFNSNFKGEVFKHNEDFIVEEIPEKGHILTVEKTNEQTNPINDFDDGSLNPTFLIFTLVKENLSTHEAIDIISRKTHTSIKRFGYFGNKDRNAVTAQRISVFKGNLNLFSKVYHPKLFLKDFYYSNKPCKIGDLYGNHFKIRIRNFDGDQDKLNEFIETAKKGLPNFYGPQRFGNNLINIQVSKAILDGDFKKAVDMLINKKKIIHQNSFEYKMKQYLEKLPNDYIGALRLIPKYLRLLILQSYQYNIYNKILSECLKENIKPEKIPLIGYDLDLNELDTKLREIFERIIKEEGIDIDNLNIRSMPEISMKSIYRDAFFIPEDIQYNLDGKDLIMQFTLKRGSYASVFLIEMLNSC